MPDPAWVTPRSSPFVGPETGGGGFLPDYDHAVFPAFSVFGTTLHDEFRSETFTPGNPAVWNLVSVQFLMEPSGDGEMPEINLAVDPDNSYFLVDAYQAFGGTGTGTPVVAILSGLVPPGKDYGVDANTNGATSTITVQQVREIPAL